MFNLLIWSSLKAKSGVVVAGAVGGREGKGVQIDCHISFQERRFTAVLRCCLVKLLDLFETFRKR